MAIDNSDLLVIQQNASGQIRKATVGALLATVTPPAVPEKISDLDDVDTSAVTDGQMLIYSTDTWVTQDVPAGVTLNDASETTKGILELATQDEVNAGTDDERAVTSLKLKTAIDALPTPNLQAVTDEGSTTTTGMTLGANLIVGKQIFGGASTNVGLEMHATKGALHLRSANNNDIAAFEIISAGSQLSHLKVLGSGDLKIGDNVNTPEGINIEINPDGSTFFRGSITAGGFDLDSLPELP